MGCGVNGGGGLVGTAGCVRRLCGVGSIQESGGGIRKLCRSGALLPCSPWGSPRGIFTVTSRGFIINSRSVLYRCPSGSRASGGECG